MPNESIITEIENLLDEIIALGGQNERTAIVPNLTVQDANPTGLTGFVIVSDDRDGDNILAKKVGSVVYSDNDDVNVMFLRGGEAIAFQQGSQSASTGDIWEIVPSTSTDIFYDRGQVGIGTATPAVDLHVVDSNVTSPAFGADDVLVVERSGDANLHINVGTANTGSIRFTDNVSGVGRLSYNHTSDEMLFFTSLNQRMVIQSDGDVGIEVSSPTAQLHIDQSSPTGGQPVLTLDQGDISEQCINMRAGGVDQDINLYTVEVTGTPTLLWDESEDAFSWNKGLRVTSGLVGIGTTSPGVDLHIINSNATSPAWLAADLFVAERAGTARIHIHTGTTNEGGLWFTDDVRGSGQLNYDHNIDAMEFATSGSQRMIIESDGDVAIGTTVASGQLHIDQSGAAAAQPVLFLDQGDISEQCIQFSSDATDRDINLYTVNVTGTPILLWDESEDAFSQNKGLRITSGELTINAPTGATGEQLTVRGDNVGGNTEIGFYAGAGDTTDDSTLSIYGLGTPGSTANRERLIIQYDQSVPVFRIQAEANGTGTLRDLIIETEGNSNQIFLDTNGRVGISAGVPSGKLHIDQSGTTAAIPVAYFDQADISEEMFEFATTIGVGNAIEAVGAKTLTTTHFIKVTLPGALTRYFPVGTIA